MQILLYTGLLLLALAILIVIHELGHFWAARIFGMRVEAFSLFFGPKIFGFKRGDTEWKISAIPLGGYVKISGMLDEHMDTEQMAEEPKPWEFRSKPIWQRLIVMLGGIFMNIILGCLIFIGIKFFKGEDKISNAKVEHGIYVSKGSAADELGFKTGDKLVTYMGEPIEYFTDVMDPNILVDRGKYFDILRDGKEMKVELPDDYLNDFIDKKQRSLFEPNALAVVTVMDTAMEGYTPDMPANAFLAGMKSKDRILMIDSTPVKLWSDVVDMLQDKPEQSFEFLVLRGDKEVRMTVATDTSSRIGIGPDISDMFTHVDYSFGQSIPRGISAAFASMMNTVKGLVALGTGNADPGKSVSGPVKIAGIMGKTFDRAGWAGFWTLTGMLSMVLAIMNLLPIPVLDGGQVVILLIEGIIGREIPPNAKEWILRIGFFLVVALMLFVFINDFMNL